MAVTILAGPSARLTGGCISAFATGTANEAVVEAIVLADRVFNPRVRALEICVGFVCIIQTKRLLALQCSR